MNKKLIVIAIIVLTLCVITTQRLSGEEKAESSAVDKIFTSVEKNKEQPGPAVPTDASAPAYRILQEKNKMVLLLCIVAATPVFLILVLFFMKKAGNCSADNVVHGSALVLVIQGTTFIVVASPTSEQLTAAIGVLGAIAGYLFGSVTRKPEKSG